MHEGANWIYMPFVVRDAVRQMHDLRNYIQYRLFFQDPSLALSLWEYR